MTALTISIGGAGYGLAALGYLVLAGALLSTRVGRQKSLVFALASMVSMAWAGTVAVTLMTGTLPTAPELQIVAALEAARSIAWLLLLGATTWGATVWARSQRPGRALAAAGLGLAALMAMGLAAIGRLGLPGTLGQVGLMVGLGLAILGLLLTEILYRHTRSEQRWHIKFLCLATGALFAYDLFLYGDAMLYGAINLVIYEARGPVQALIIPMVAIAALRTRKWTTDISISRDVVLRSTTLLASGIYLFLMALAGYFLGEVIPQHGPVLQIVFLVGAAAVLAVVLFSGTSRAHLKVLINKHFFKGRYDWRQEWLRFMETLSANQSSTALEERAIRAVADIMESPGGAMWLVVNGRCEFVHRWNMAAPDIDVSLDDSLGRFLAAKGWVVDIRAAKADPAAYPDLELPESLARFDRAWLLVPLFHDHLSGFILLAPARAPRSLDWEDYDLLKTVGRQVASYLSEQQALRALDQAREFEIFNRGFAFVVHDIKNLMSQLSVLGSNFDKYGENEAFRRDVAESLHEAAAKMKRLMSRIDSAQGDGQSGATIPLAPLIGRIVAEKSNGGAKIVFSDGGADLVVAGDADKLEAMIGHLIQNAVDAVGQEGQVEVVLESRGETAVIRIVDNGPGMDTAFLSKELFRPFRSTKREGMGIGAYQCREYARELGGNLDAQSRVGEGTTMRVILPVARVGKALDFAEAGVQGR